MWTDEKGEAEVDYPVAKDGLGLVVSFDSQFDENVSFENLDKMKYRKMYCKVE